MISVIETPVATEKTMLLIEKENKLTFRVRKSATKDQVSREVEERFSVKVDSVNVLFDKKGKKAVVKLKEGFSAEEIGTRIGIF
ncbi:MAG: 50S ribosomal protein L23 [Candidatus Thermoplasmatota archaeon]|jgi:large subunit ribosomal protein L23|nr:50S ribosomal protein L23 [Candidatus Thermoplasmatota archaeon]MCL5800139.1 50S ribosomal protein L23 [Candidatus Thermoplasmatota archaeon]